VKTLNADVVVIGGGSTGCGIARDAAMRGFSAILVERGDIAQGTSARFHGLLHSGGRYVVSDPESAAECALENAIVKRIQPGAVEDTGGLFVALAGGDEAFEEKFLQGCAAVGLAHEEITPAAARRLEPRLSPAVTRAVKVEDGTVDGWTMTWGAVRSAVAYGARALRYTTVTGIELKGGRVAAVRCHDRKADEDVLIDAGFVINAAGPWVGQIAALVGIHDIDVVPGQGVMVAAAHRLSSRVLNRMAKPGDGDIMVPAHTVSIIGTTDTPAEDPDDLAMPRTKIQQMLDSGEALVPGFRAARALHSWVGARPLIKDARVQAGDTRGMRRGMFIFDHAERDGVDGLISVAGGKLTTYRLMAQRAVDTMCEKLGETRPCRTAEEPVPSREQHIHRITDRLAAAEATRREDPVVCECELLGRARLVELVKRYPESSLDDLRRRTRLGMGPCQGGFCAARAAGIACEEGEWSAERATAALRLFLKNRWIGQWPVLFGDLARQVALDNWSLYGALDLAHAPSGEEVVL
jgi:glycerol-3-phosphate dehydrogenase